MTEVFDGELIESQELVPRDAPAPTLFGTDDPRLMMAKAANVADVLKEVVDKQGMSVMISGRPYIKVDAWAALGNILGVYPKTEYTRELTNDEGVSQGWEAAVVVVNSRGVEIGRAEAQCLRAERNWKGRDDFALRSMAQTRAMGKALRMPLGWIAVLAGYEATPAEEMPAQAVADDDTPFDQTGPQGPDADGMKAHGEQGTGTGASTTPPPAMTRAEANEVRRFALTERLHELCALLDKDENDTSKLIAADRLTNDGKLASHLTWLEKQVKNAEAAVDAKQEEIPL